MTNSTKRYVCRHAATAALVAVAALFPALGADAGAREIRGTVTNGTTGKPFGPVKVTIVDPRHGMVTQDEIRSDARGSFAARNLSDKVSMFLVQVSHEGVTYTEIVQPEKDTVEVEVKVYDTTPSWENISVSLPHFMARRSDDTLSIDRIFVVSNRTTPPRTVSGPGAGFTVNIPEERLRITSVFATSLGFPIAVDPRPTDRPGVYAIDYPFKPGDTQVGISFDVAYPESGYVYAETIPYALDDAVVMTEDPRMEVTSAALTLGEPEEVRGHKAYRLGPIPRSSALALAFRGGAARSAPAPTGHQIVTLRDLDGRASIALIAGFTLLLVLVLALGSKSAPVGADPAALLASSKDETLNRIARLDDLFEMGTVPDRLYREKRAELVETLSRIMRSAGEARSKKSGKARPSKGTPDAR